MRKLLRRGLIVFLQTAVLFLIIEATLRFAGVKPQIALLNPEGPFLVHATRKWRLKPNYKGKWSDVPFETNSLGQRDDEIAATKPKGTFRLLVLGGSVATGYRMERHQAYPDLLEDVLRKTASQPVEVVNAAIPGYAPFQHLLYYRESGRLLKPDLVVIDFAINDIIDKQRNLKKHGGRGEFQGGGAFFRFEGGGKNDWKSILQILPRYTALYSVATWIKTTAFAKVLAQKQHDEEEILLRRLIENNLSEELSRAWDDTEKELQTLANEIRATGTPLVIVMFPLRVQALAASGLAAPQDRLRAFCRARQIPFVDFLPHFRKRVADDGGPERAFIDDEHPTIIGQNLATQVLFKTVFPIVAPNLSQAVSPSNPAKPNNP